jgi:hypothetical protein
MQCTMCEAHFIQLLELFPQSVLNMKVQFIKRGREEGMSEI